MVLILKIRFLVRHLMVKSMVWISVCTYLGSLRRKIGKRAGPKTMKYWSGPEFGKNHKYLDRTLLKNGPIQNLIRFEIWSGFH